MKSIRFRCARVGLVLGFLFCTAVARGGVNRWTSIGPEGGRITAIAIDPESPSTVYATSAAGVFKSLDGGATWASASAGLLQGYPGSTTVGAIAIDPSSPSTIFASVGQGLFKSVNAAATWTGVLGDARVRAVAVDPASPSTVYVAVGAVYFESTTGGIYKSTDDGKTWTTLSTGTHDAVTTLAIDPEAPGTLYAGTSSSAFIGAASARRILKSANAGATWAAVGPNSYYVGWLTVDPRSSSVFAAIGGSIHRSMDRGATWVPFGTRYGSALVVDPASASTFDLCSRDGVLQTRDDGASWSRILLSGCFGIALSGAGSIYAALDDGIARSSDGGANWLSDGRGLRAEQIDELAVDPSDPSTIYAAVPGALQKTTDGGATWTKILVRPGATIRAIAVNPASPNVLFVAGGNSGTLFGGLGTGWILESRDGGGTWIPAGSGITDSVIEDIEFDQRNPATAYAIGINRGVFRTTNSGGTWSAVGGAASPPGAFLEIDPVTSTVFAGSQSAGVFRSTDGGASWSAVNEGLTSTYLNDLKIVRGGSGTLLAGTNIGLFATSDGGASWRIVADLGVNCLAVSADGANAYAGAWNTIYRSINGGATWSRAPDFESASVSNLEVASDGKVYAGTSSAGVLEATFRDTSPCVAGPTTLCLNGGRFRVEVDWRAVNQGTKGPGRAVPLTGDTGAFWFFQPTNLELMVKVLDATSFSGYFWVFSGALTDVEYALRVTDTETGATKTYFNAQGHQASNADTTAFPGSSGSVRDFDVAAASTASALADVCQAGSKALCLNGGRFRVDVAWKTSGGAGAGQPVPLTSDTGAFWFFQPSNLELMVKVLDARAFDGHFWVFFGALSDVGYTITVTDTATGSVREYENPPGRLASFADTSAF